MAKKAIIDKNIKRIVLEFGNRLKNQGVSVKKLIVFGSYAKGNARKESDVDICVVSPKFGKDTVDELQFLLKQSWRVDARIEPYLASPKEFEKAASPLLFEIKKFGQEIKILK